MSIKLPNILVVGTPGVGKTTFSLEVCIALNGMLKEISREDLRFNHVEVSKIIKEENLFSEWDKDRDCSIYDEELVHDHLFDLIMQHPDGGLIMDFHSTSPFDKEWFQGFVLLRCGTEALYDRLHERGYNEEKVRENNEAEIFGMVKEELLSELLPVFEDEIDYEDYFELENDSFNLLQLNVDKMVHWVRGVLKN